MRPAKKLLSLLLCLCLAVSCSGCALVEYVAGSVKEGVEGAFSRLPFGGIGEKEPSPEPSVSFLPAPTPSPSPTVRPTQRPTAAPTPTPEPESKFFFIDGGDGTALFVEYEGTEREVVVPDEYLGLPVTSIYEEAFLGNESITSVFIPDTVEFIGERVFAGCKNLERVRLPVRVFDIAEDLFFESGLKEIELPENTWMIWDGAFEGCKELREVKIPEMVTSINARTFARCEKLTKVTVPPGVTRIASDAFEGCGALTIYGYTGSEAERFANGNGIPFVSIGGSPTPAPTPKPESKPSNSGSGDVDLPAGVVRKAITLTSDWDNSITLYPDKTFCLFVNLYEGYGSVYGTYQASGRIYDFTVTDRDFYGFIGDDVWSFRMEANGNTLTYSGSQIGMVESGYCFR